MRGQYKPETQLEDFTMAKKSKGGKKAAPKKRPAKSKAGKRTKKK
jgi:hypothetical protein